MKLIKTFLGKTGLPVTVFLAVCLTCQMAAAWGLGSIGGAFSPMAGTNMIEVTSVESAGPGGVGGLQVGDRIYKAFGKQFEVFSSNASDGYKGSVQNLAEAIERAEASDGVLNLSVIRPNTGNVDLTINLPVAGAFGPAYPLGSSKFDAMYQWGCEQIHARSTASSSGNFQHGAGYLGLILISHPNWNDTSGPKPYRLTVDRIKDYCLGWLAGRVIDPVEGLNNDGTPNDGSARDSNPNDQNYVGAGLENWSVAAFSMFLAEYRLKTGDTSIDSKLQDAADMLCNRVQDYSEYLNGGGPYGRMGHGGVGGDYDGKGLNIINAHTLTALSMLKRAGATVDDAKFQACWSMVRGATGGNGAVGYWTSGGGAYDSMGRTAGVAFGMENYGGLSAADQAIVDKQKDYIWRYWERMQHTHAYTVGGVVFTQFALPFLEDRQQRYLMENQRLFYHFHRNTAGTLSYFGGRFNNGGDGTAYIGTNNTVIINTCIAQAIASGNLMSFPAPNTARIHADFKSPFLTWPTIDARQVTLSSLTQAFNVDVTDYQGAVLPVADYTATWTNISGPAAATFTSPNTASTSVSFPQDGTYRIQLEVVKGSYTLTEPIDVIVSTAPPVVTAPSITTQPTSQSTTLGGNASFSVSVTGDGPFLYEWFLDGSSISSSTSPTLSLQNVSAGHVGDYYCVVYHPNGSLTSSTVNLTVSGTGTLVKGGLWRDQFNGIPTSAMVSLMNFSTYPRFPDSAEVLSSAESGRNIGSDYGSRWTGWVHPDVTGNYTFYIASDEQSELWLSTDDQPGNKVKIASLVSKSSYRNWAGGGISPSISLTAGQRYYIEVIHTEGSSDDHCSVAWSKPGEGVPAAGSSPIPGEYFSYVTGGVFGSTVTSPPLFSSGNYSWSVDETASIGSQVGILSATTSSPSLTYSIFDGNGDGMFSLNSSTGEITLAKELDYEVVTSYTLTVRAADGSGLLGQATVTINVNDIYDASFIVNTDFEAADGFTGYASNSYATLQTTIDNLGAQWSTPGGAYIWNKSGLPPSGVQCLVLGLGGSPSSAEITIPGVDHGVGTVSFDYSSYSSSTNATTKLYYRQNGGAWVEAWSVTIVGMSPNWQVKPWQPVTVNINQTGDVDLKFETIGTAGIQIDTIQVKDNRPNLAPIANNSTMSIAETAAIGDSVGTVDVDNTNIGDPLTYVITAGNTGNAFAINASTGEITVNSALDYATLNTYSLTVAVTDSLGLSDTATVTVEVLQEYFIDDFERTAGTTIGNGWIELTNDARIYDSANPNGATLAVISVNAGDTFSVVRPLTSTFVTDQRYKLMWNATRTASANGTMVYDVSIGSWDSATSTFTPLASQNGSILSLNIKGKKAGPTVYGTATAAEAGKVIAIRLQTLAGSDDWAAFDDIKLEALPVNVPPVAVNATFAVTEASPAGVIVGTVSSVDANEGEDLIYSITAGNTGGEFAINSATGEITTTATALDYETQNSYALTVSVTDVGGASDSASINIDVIDAPDDVDNDGLFDDWEMTNFGNLTTADGTSDSDGDGQSDSAEQNSGTNPTDVTDVLKVTQLSKGSSNSTIKWAAKNGKLYKVQSSYDLSHWVNIATGQSGNAGEGLYLDTNAARVNSSKVFYRVLVE